MGGGRAKAMTPGANPASRLHGIEENPEGFDDFRRELLQRFTPAITGLHWQLLPCTLHDGKPGHVALLNLERPSIWDEVSDWINREGSIQNAKLCEIAKIDTLRASKMLGVWREQGLLVPLPNRAKRNMAYTKPTRSGPAQSDLLSTLEENNGPRSK